MSIGLILLIAAGVLVLFGVGQRVLDRLRLTDKQALLFMLLILVGGLIPDIPLGNMVRVNLGGCVVPLALCIYLIVRAGTNKERVRSIIAAVLTGAAVWAIGYFVPNEPEQMPFDVNYVYGLAGGAIAYILGRSRRGAFIAGVLGILLADTFQAILNWNQGIAQTLTLGGAGAVDAVVISGFLAVLLAELVGELIERMTRGTRERDDAEFHGGSFTRKEKEK